MSSASNIASSTESESSTKEASSQNIEPCAHEHEPVLEFFAMYNNDPMHEPSNDYLEKLKGRFEEVCQEKNNWQKRQQCLDVFNEQLQVILKWRRTEHWFGPPSDSWHFEGDAFFSDFLFHDLYPKHLYKPWEFPTRQEIEEHLSSLKHISFVHKTGLFAQTLNKFLLKHCRKERDKERDPVIVDLPPSTKENPIRLRLWEGYQKKPWYNYEYDWPIYLVGHDTVIANKGLSGIFKGFGDHDPAHQLICFDITFMGNVIEPAGTYPCARFYNCTFTEAIGLNQNAMLIDCEGTEVFIHMTHTVRMLNCQFNVVNIRSGRLLAKGCKFGTMDVMKTATSSLYFLEDCTVGEKTSSGDQCASGRSLWPQPERFVQAAFEKMEKDAFRPIRFNP